MNLNREKDSQIDSVIVKGEYNVVNNDVELQNLAKLNPETFASVAEDESNVKFEITEIEDDTPYIRYHCSNANDNQCQICGKNFTRRSNLEMHMAIHPKVKTKSKIEPETQPKSKLKAVNTKEVQPKERTKTLRSTENSVDVEKNSDPSECKKQKKLRRTRSASDPFSCAHCSTTFKLKSSVIRHLKAFHVTKKKDPKDISCLICQKKMPDLKTLGIHMFNHSKEKPSKCEICGEIFLYRIHRDRHIKLNHKSDKEPIVKKGKSSHTSAQLRKSSSTDRDHLRSHKDIPNNFECDFCCQKFKTKHFLSKHMKDHQKYSYSCHMCNETFTEKHSLKGHLIRHMDKFTKCVHCSMVFIKSQNYKKHLKNIHPGLPGKISDTTISCTICGKKFDQMKNLKSHVEIHQTSIDRKLSDKNLPDNNIRKNQKSECIRTNYYCPYRPDCGKWFKHKKNFIAHMDMHESDNIYKCSICLKVFANKRLVTKHESIHKKKSVFKCNVCNRIFRSGWKLMIHEKKHDLEDTVECPDCNGSGFVLVEQCDK